MIKLTWYSHACLMLETKSAKILVDPFITGNPLSPIDPERLKADYIFVSHGHADHLGDTESIARNCSSTVIANPEISGWLQSKGIEKIQHIQIGGAVKFPWGKAKMTYATHSSSLPDGSYGGNPGGFIFYVGDKKIYHACDTGLFGDMTLIGEEGIDIAFLPIGDAYTMGIEDSVKAVNFIKPDKVVPIHYGTFELISQNPEDWGEQIKKETDSEPVILRPGDSIKL
ncbi:MAG: metal-dependent hydrolase [Victivallales bacterium]|nr:metal-dependent hydrolase [Victivallales bacterium]